MRRRRRATRRRAAAGGGDDRELAAAVGWVASASRCELVLVGDRGRDDGGLDPEDGSAEGVAVGEKV